MRTGRRVYRWIAEAPFKSFLVLLVFFFVVIAGLSQLRQPGDDQMTDDQRVIPVRALDFYEDTTVTVYGTADHSGVTTVTAAASGVVFHLPIVEGMYVTKGTNLLTITETHSGTNSALISKKIADNTVAHQNEIFRRNSKVIDLEKKEYQADNDHHSVLRHQYEINRENLTLSRDQAVLNQQQASLNLARFYPRAPFAGTVERVMVRAGDTITQGAPLAMIRGAGEEVRIDATVSRAVAEAVDMSAAAEITLADGRTITRTPTHVTQLPTDAEAYHVSFVFEDQGHLFYDGMHVTIALPLRAQDATLVPLDAVQVSHDGAIVFVVQGEHAQSRRVSVGEVVGGFATITEGLSQGDRVIIDRTVVEGDRVEVQE